LSSSGVASLANVQGVNPGTFTSTITVFTAVPTPSSLNFILPPTNLSTTEKGLIAGVVVIGVMMVVIGIIAIVACLGHRHKDLPYEDIHAGEDAVGVEMSNKA